MPPAFPETSDALTVGEGEGIVEAIDRRVFLKWSLGFAGTIVGPGARLLGWTAAYGATGTGTGPALVVGQGLSSSTVDLLWTAVPGANAYQVYRDGSLIASQLGTLFQDTGLAPLDTHTYEVAALVDGAETLGSPPVTLRTQAADDTAPPSTPGPVKVTKIASDSVSLSWTKSTDNLGVVGYRILRGASGAPVADLRQLETTDATTSYTAKTLMADTGYQFAVVAVDAGGNLSPARTITVTTKPSSGPATPPAAPSSSSVSGTAWSGSRIDLVWAPSSSSGVVAYRIFRDGAMIGEVALPYRRTYSDNGLTSSTRYTYQVQAVDNRGNTSPLTTGRAVTTLAAQTVKITRGPYLQWATEDSIRIAWFTNLPAPSKVEYGIGALTDQTSDAVLQRQHVMLLGGLQPGTRYLYRVTSGGAVASASFRTAAAPGQAFAFAAVGDYGGGSAQETAIAASIAALGSEFVQTLGDNVYPDCQDPDPATTYSDYDARLFKPYRAVLAEQSFWIANGNKEYYGDGAIFRTFSMPNNRRWYSYDWGDAHVLVLDTEQPYLPGTPQYEFASADLAASQGRRWRIVVTHRPPYSSTTAKSSSQSVVSNLVPLFEEHDVHLVLSGNSHNYERTQPLQGGIPAAAGVTYVVSGGGGNGLNQFSMAQPSWSAFRKATYQFLKISVGPDTLRLEAVESGTEAVIDSVTLAS